MVWSKEISKSTRPIFTKFSETCWCRCSIWYWFYNWSRDVATATNFRREIGRNRRHAFILETRIPQRMARWESGWAH